MDHHWLTPSVLSNDQYELLGKMILQELQGIRNDLKIEIRNLGAKLSYHLSGKKDFEKWDSKSHDNNKENDADENEALFDLQHQNLEMPEESDCYVNDNVNGCLEKEIVVEVNQIKNEFIPEKESPPSATFVNSIHSAVNNALKCNAKNDQPVSFDKNMDDSDIYCINTCSDFRDRSLSNSQLNCHPNKTKLGRKRWCEICAKYLHASGFNRHIRSHTGERPFKCEICFKCFNQRYRLKKHQIKFHGTIGHNASRNQNKSFSKAVKNADSSVTSVVSGTSKGVLRSRPSSGVPLSQPNRKPEEVCFKVRTMTHTTKRPFHCPLCNKAFSSSSYLTIHARTHTGEKPHHCELCGKAFLRKGDLKRHIKIHANKGPFKCPICSEVFAKINTMHKHMEMHLPQIKVELCETSTSSVVTKANINEAEE